jgi:predicted RNA-binding protein with PUA-like domain
MAYWILKSEPSVYPYERLERERRTVWDGVRNPQALGYLRQMQPGDTALIYHSNEGKEIVGTATIITAAYPDPTEDGDKIVVVEIEVGTRLPHPVGLATIKATKALADIGLVRQSRLSVMPATPTQWQTLLRLAGTKA